MDLRTIEVNIYSDSYVSINQFISDVKKIWANAYIYNLKNSQIYQMTTEVEKHFNKILQE
jgi:hypothetical protein